MLRLSRRTLCALFIMICAGVLVAGEVGASARTVTASAPSETTCGTSSSIASNFNGTKIAAGSTIWFTAVFKLNGSVPSSDFSLSFTGQTITSSAFTISVPDGVVNFSTAATQASTTFDG